nr:GH92 family glycosyl hydrolase [Bacteroidales bacterium]
LGDILLLPVVIGGEEHLAKSYFKESEKASVGYYSHVKKDGIKVELTCSERVALHKYTYPGNNAGVIVNFDHGLRFLTDSLVLESKVTIEDSLTLSGFCHTKNWVERKYFFTVVFDKPFIKIETNQSKSSKGAPKYLLNFILDDTKSLQIKVALSTVSVEGAKRNLKSEMDDWDFCKVRRDAELSWSNYLNRVDIEADHKQKEIFYTSLYHLLLQPSNIADIDGKYRGADNRIRVAPNNEYYSTLSIWDIYRGAFPLLQIIVPEKIDGIVNSLLLHHEAAGFLPIWTVWGQDNYCMIGNHAIPMILSATINGFKGFDRSLALEAMVKTSTESHINSDWEIYNQFGYYPYDLLDNESVSRTLESGFDDWCVSQMASILDSNLTAKKFLKRANYYKNLFDSESSLFRGKDSKGN